MRSPSSPLASIAGLLVCGALWGATIPLTKVATSGGHHPIGLLVWQLVVASVLLGALVLRRAIEVPLDATHLRLYAVIAVSGTLLPNSMSLFAYPHLDSAVMAIVIATVPLLTLLVAALARTERIDGPRLLGIALGVSALLLIALPEASLPSRAALPWVAVALIAPLCYAIESNVVAARAPPALSPIAMLFAASVLGTALTVPTAAALGVHVNPFVPWTRVEFALALSALGHVGAYTGYLWLLGRAGAVFSSQIGYVVTLTAVGIGIVFLDERPTTMVLLAVPLMLGGIALVQPRRSLETTRAA